MTTVLFSVSPSQSPTGTFVPSVVTTRAATTHWPASSIPSTITTATSRSERSLAISSASAASVARFQRRETELRRVPLALGGGDITRSAGFAPLG